MNLYAYVRNDPLNAADPTGTIKLSFGVEGEITAGLGLGAGADVQVSFPVPFLDPDANFDVGWSIYGSARAGVMVGGGVVGSVEKGSVSDTPTLGLEFDAIAGSEAVQVGVSSPVEFRDGQLVETGQMGPRGSAEARTRTRAGPSTGGGSEGITGRWTGSARRAAEYVGQIVNPQQPQQPQPPPREGGPTDEERGRRPGPDQ